MCRWILDGVQAFDAKQVLHAVEPSRLPSTFVGPAASGVVPGSVLAGFAELAVEAKIAPERTAPFESELLSLGAVHVGEVRKTYGVRSTTFLTETTQKLATGKGTTSFASVCILFQLNCTRASTVCNT